MDLARILAYITGTVDQELLLRNEYLVAENRILKAQLKTPLRLTDSERMTLAEEEIERCVIRAERSGLVIYPSTAEWKDAPDIAEGATVHNDQVLLLMPDLSKMQVKVGIHETMVDHVRPGMDARVTIPGRTLEGEVASVASTAQPAGWWTGNIVKYDAIIQLPSVEGLKPGMSAEVEILMGRHEDVLMIPLTAVVEAEQGQFCWVGTPDKAQRRSLQVGDSNDAFVVVQAGLEEGDQVVLNPTTFFKEAERLSLASTHSRQSQSLGNLAGE